MRSFRSRLLTLSAAACFALVACGRQGEGERCDIRSGSSDCEPPLVCVTGADLAGFEDIPGAALCCPPAGQPATDPACFPAGATFDDFEDEDEDEDEDFPAPSPTPAPGDDPEAVDGDDLGDAGDAGGS